MVSSFSIYRLAAQVIGLVVNASDCEASLRKRRYHRSAPITAVRFYPSRDIPHYNEVKATLTSGCSMPGEMLLSKKIFLRSNPGKKESGAGVERGFRFAIPEISRV